MHKEVLTVRAGKLDREHPKVANCCSTLPKPAYACLYTSHVSAHVFAHVHTYIYPHVNAQVSA